MQPEYNQQDQPGTPPPPEAPSPYPASMPMPSPQSQISKKMILLGGGGIILLLALIGWLLFGGKTPAGFDTMQSTVQNTSEALGILNDYVDDVQSSNLKNNLALSQTLLLGSYKELNDIYNTTYKPKKKLSNSPKADATSKELLDSAERNNRLDSEIVQLLQNKVTAAETSLQAAAPNFSKPETKSQINDAYTSLQSVNSLLNQP